MTVDRIVHLMAGLMVLLSIGLAHFTGNVAWLWLTTFVGVNLAQSGVTGFCPLAFVLRKSGVKEGSCCS
jgi:hypothetical protein